MASGWTHSWQRHASPRRPHVISTSLLLFIHRLAARSPSDFSLRAVSSGLGSACCEKVGDLQTEHALAVDPIRMSFGSRTKEGKKKTIYGKPFRFRALPKHSPLLFYGHACPKGRHSTCPHIQTRCEVSTSHHHPAARNARHGYPDQNHRRRAGCAESTRMSVS